MIKQTTRTKMQFAFVATGAALLLVTGSGCGKLVNGANSATTVKYRPASKEAVAETTAVAVAATTDAAPGEVGVGTLKGRVVYVGSYTPLAPLFAKGAAAKDPSVCGAGVIPDESILVKDGGLANVFIYLDKIPKGAVIPAVGNPILFDQKVCIFTPHAMLVRVKQTVKVLNADGVAHNTHTYPKKNTDFNNIVNPNDRNGIDVTYGQPEKEPFRVGCDIHSWMTAYHLPLDHPFGAVSAADGTFEIKDLPAGKHEFKVWHEAGKMVEKAFVVTIKPGDNEVTINVPASKLGK
ncbi:MAG: hypothetical protein H7062_16755 [Candidatus Saccharimonas sp.]|nr:hypothetical protein [Planctomycetaceae bacterium]